MFRLCSDVTSTEFHLSSVQRLQKRRKTRQTHSSSRGASTGGFIHDSNTNEFLKTFQGSIIFFQNFLMKKAALKNSRVSTSGMEEILVQHLADPLCGPGQL